MQEEQVTVFTALRHSICVEHQLVLQSQGIECEVLSREGGCALTVAAADVVRARAQLAAYAEENRNYVVRPTVVSVDYHKPWSAMLAYLLALWGIAIAAEVSLLGVDWYSAGRVNSGRILTGEVWRLATGLTLHIDLQHIVANSGFGLALGYYAGRYFGSGVACLTVLLSGILGNALNVVARGAGHFSIGASTAVFGMLGLIGIYTWRMRLFPQQRWPQRTGPVVGALALLAYTGAGGERTDVGAHFWGFAVGGGIGWLLAWCAPAIDFHSKSLQRNSGAIAAGLLGGAWIAALVSAA